jgi:hypothetical protein
MMAGLYHRLLYHWHDHLVLVKNLKDFFSIDFVHFNEFFLSRKGDGKKGWLSMDKEDSIRDIENLINEWPRDKLNSFLSWPTWRRWAHNYRNFEKLGFHSTGRTRCRRTLPARWLWSCNNAPFPTQLLPSLSPANSESSRTTSKKIQKNLTSCSGYFFLHVRECVCYL